MKGEERVLMAMVSAIDVAMEAIPERAPPQDAMLVIGEQVHGFFIDGRLLASDHLFRQLAALGVDRNCVPPLERGIEISVFPVLPLSVKAALTMVAIAKDAKCRQPMPLFRR